MKLTLKKGPLYAQVQEILRNRIVSGKYPKGSLIPSEVELKEEFDVSLITIRRAVEQLSNQGYVEKKSGIGTTVLDNYAISKLSKGQRFSQHLIEEGYELKKESASILTVDLLENYPELVDDFGATCHCVERLYTLEGKPYIHFKHFITKDIMLPNDSEVLLGSLYEIISEQGIKFNRFKDEFGIEVPDASITDQLQLEQKPLLKRIRYSYDINDQLIEFSVGYYNTDIHKYVVNFDV
ncbi:GntR family transcriptional regulator [Paraliobacillus salinarum]|uniref:GntR family transcriptional regulator n=1 Tax=Paraliobacillus salinarum TaxID=1158996 RepID=UPI0015F57440|nr:GntR family transcriptional regulator [Paraliobacillus salinarum]